MSFSTLNFGVNITESDHDLETPFQVIDLTGPDESIDYITPLDNNVILEDAIGFEVEKSSYDIRAQVFKSQASSDESRTHKSGKKKKKRKKNATLRRAIQKLYDQERQQELNIERCQALSKKTNQESKTTKTHSMKDQNLHVEKAFNLLDVRSTEASKHEELEIEMRQPQVSEGNKSLASSNMTGPTLSTMEKEEFTVPQNSEIMAEKEIEILPSLNREQIPAKYKDEIKSMVINSAITNNYCLSMDEGKSLNSCIMADDETFVEIKEKDIGGNLLLSVKEAESLSVNVEKQKEQSSIEGCHIQQALKAKEIGLNDKKYRKKQKKKILSGCNNKYCLTGSLAKKDGNFNQPKNITIIDLSSPVLTKNVLTMPNCKSNIITKKKNPAKSKNKVVSNASALVTTMPKTKEAKRSKRALKKARKRNQAASVNSNNINIGTSKINDLNSEHRKEKLEQGVPGSNLKKIPDYLEPYKTDTEKEVLSLMRELLGIV